MLYLDGAFGTYYKEKTNLNEIPELANINNPDIVFEIHSDYIKAGANAIITNTFAANSNYFKSKEDIALCITNAYNTALKAANGQAKVFADIGYINGEYSNTLFLSKEEEYKYLASVFLSLGAKYILFETFGEYDILKSTLRFIKETNNDIYIAVTFAASQDGFTIEGYSYKQLLKEVVEDKLTDATGLNCICGPAHMHKLLKELEPSIFNTIDIIAMPNSGYPTRLNGESFFDKNAEYFALKMSEIALLGVKILGGCCGTTPLHIKKMVDMQKSNKHIKEIINDSISSTSTLSNKVKIYNRFEEKLRNNKKAIAVELDPPTDTNFEQILSSARDLKQAGADIITLADSPLARTRASSFIIGSKLMREANIDVMPHLTCRDRNNIGISAELLGGSIEGIRNVLTITGDPAAYGTKGVFSFNSMKLIEYIKLMNTEHFKEAPYFIGGALNTSATNFNHELNRAMKKKEAGASFFMTQPIFTKANINNLIEAKRNLTGCYILAGIYPVVSYKNALFLNNEVSGIEIPEEIIESFYNKSKEEAKNISVSNSLKIIEKVYNICDGLYIMLPLKRTDIVLKILEEIKNGDAQK